MATVEQLTYNSPDGATMGKSATEKISFYGVTPVVQRSGSVQATFTVTISTSDTGWAFKTSDQFNAFIAQMREIQATLIGLGFWAGS